ncbi:hypothetical protein ABPG72_001717 [Tetrahymena utriculariae]
MEQQKYQIFAKKIKDEQVFTNKKNKKQQQRQDTQCNDVQQQFFQDIQHQMVFDFDSEIVQANLNYQKIARTENNNCRQFDYKKKHDLRQEIIPSQRIGEKLEANKVKEKQKRQKIDQKKEYYEQRIKYFQYYEPILSKLEQSFYNNKSHYITIWEQSQNNLKVQVDTISKIILKPIQVDLSDKEINIILQNQNQLTIGRSGTGKTTTAVVKLAAMQMGNNKEQINNLASGSSEQLRICFTTISNFLTLDVENLYNRIVKMPQPRAFQKPNALSQVQKWPHFTNIKELILQIDGNLAIPYIQRDNEDQIIQANNMEINLENRLRVQIKDEIENKQYTEIGIKQFVQEFWFQNKTKFDYLKVDPYVVYSQINSYITGHPLSYQSDKNMISLEKYITLIGKSKIGLNQEEKINIYKICDLYQKWKCQNSYFDLNDIINYIIKNILEGNYDTENGYFHYLFLDEVQDLNCACLYLLCLLTEQGVYLGGDTAQTINQENSFRFSDLKSIFGESNKIYGYQVNNVLSQELNESQLTQNFRSHGQIIELNNSIVRLLEIFFPTSLDHLIPEISLKKGPKPLLINQRKHLYSFLSQDSEVNVQVDYFGRLQVYIVKDQEQKENLRKLLENENKKGQIFTVLESKGLEFQDVISYNLLSSSFNSTQCWNALNLLKISVEKIPIEDFKFKYNCDLKQEFEGSTFRRPKGSNFVQMKVIQKQENADSQIIKDYSKDFNRLINELKNIYVTFSRARSRVFIYEDSTFVGKQIKNPIVKYLQDLNLLEERELNDEEQIKNILIDHFSYIKQNEPVKNNRQQFISMAEMLIERNQFLDAAYYYETVGDELNKKLCISKDKILQIQRQIEDKKDIFEKEKKQMLSEQGDSKNIQFYLNVKKQFLEAIRGLEEPKELELNAQIYFKLGMYNEAIQKYKEFKSFLQKSSDDFKQFQKKINEVNCNIKHIYFLKANLLENFPNKKKDQYQNYQELESFLEKDGVQDVKVQLYLSFRLENYEKLFNNLIKFKEKNLIEKGDLIHILNYYYPKILEIKLQRINQINVQQKDNFKNMIKNLIYNVEDPKTILGHALIDLIQQIIIPFKEEFIRIARSRQNMEYFQEQLKFFNELSNSQQLKYLDQAQQFLNGYNIMLFYIMLVHFDCLEQQMKFNSILEQQALSHLLFIEQILQNKNNKQKVEKIFMDMKQITWLKSGNTINIDYQYYYTYLGFYEDLKAINFVKDKSESDKYQNFTFQLCSFKRNFSEDEHINQIIFIQEQIVKQKQFQLDQIKDYQDQIKHYYQTLQFLKQSKRDSYWYKIQLGQAVENINDIISKKQIQGKNQILKFIYCQDQLLHFFYCLKMLKIQNIQLFDNKFIESLTSLINYILTIDSEIFESQLIGEQNKIFIDAFCSCFGFISHIIPGEDIIDKEFKSVWQLIGYNDYYLVHYDNPFIDTGILEKNKLISPLLSSEFNKLKIIEKKTAILLSKKEFGQYCTDFLKEYSCFLIKCIKRTEFFQKPPQTKIMYPFQILFLNNQLQQLIQKNHEQIKILEKNIPKKHSRDHEIQSIKKLIKLIDINERQSEQKIFNLNTLLQRKEIQQQKDQGTINISNLDIKLLDEDQIYKCKSYIIQSGLVISQFFYSRNYLNTKDTIYQYLLDEASDILAQILKKIEQQDIQQESYQIFKNYQVLLDNQKAKYLQQYNQIYQFQEQIEIEDQDSEYQVSSNNDKNKINQNQQLKKDNKQIKQVFDEENEEFQEEQENEEENILQSCDDILYAITILNISNVRPILQSLIQPYPYNQLTQFAQKCIKFFEARCSQDRINIGLLSIELIQQFRQNINYFTQIYLFQIGLSEMLLLLNTYKNDPSKKVQVCIPLGFENCFTFNENTDQIKVQVFPKQVDFRLKTKLLEQKEFAQKVCQFLKYFQKDIKIFNNKQEPFKNIDQYKTTSNEAYQCTDDQYQYYLYKIFSQKFHKTFLQLVQQSIDNQNKNNENLFQLSQFINQIRFAEIQHVLINFIQPNQIIYCQLQVKILKQEREEKNNSVKQEEEDEIKYKINEKRREIIQNQIQILSEQQCITNFYQPDFINFLNQIIFYENINFTLFKDNIFQQKEVFQQNFQRAIIQIQKTRKIFLQELSQNRFQSSEKYIYIIQKLTSILQIEKDFYEQLSNNVAYIKLNSNFKPLIEYDSNKCIDQMEKVYMDYLNYIIEPIEKVEKEKLDIQKFIQEQLNSQNRFW